MEMFPMSIPPMQSNLPPTALLVLVLSNYSSLGGGNTRVILHHVRLQPELLRPCEAAKIPMTCELSWGAIRNPIAW